MGLNTRRPQLPSLNLPGINNRSDIVIDQCDGAAGAGQRQHDSGSGIITPFQRNLDVSAPSTPITPSPGTPLVFDEIPMYRSSTPVTPGFANGPNPFSFSFSQPSTQASSTSSSQTGSCGSLSDHRDKTPSPANMSSYGEVPRLPSAASSRSVVTPGLIPSFGTLNGHNAGTAQRRSHQFSDESSAPEEAWSDRELDLLESFLLNPLRPLSTTYPPGTLPPSAALDELTSQIIHFHQPVVAESSTRNLQVRGACHPGMTTSRSAPSLKSESHRVKIPARQKHRRTHSSSGIPWTHSWRATRRKLYEIARKEALGDSREDRFKGRLDINRRGSSTPAELESGAISPMPENLYGPRTFDFGLQGSPRTTAAVLSVSGTENPAGRPSDDCRNEPRFGGLLSQSSTAVGTSQRFGSLHNAIRPTSLLQRGKSFTAEEFSAALSLKETSPPNISGHQLPNRESSPVSGGRAVTPAMTLTSPPIAGQQLRDSRSSPGSSDGPKTPDTLPGITLTTPSPCSRNRNEQMQAMGSPLPGTADVDRSAFGGPLDVGLQNEKSSTSKKLSSSRPSTLFRSRSGWDETESPSLVRQFIQGPTVPRHAHSDLSNLGSPVAIADSSRQCEDNLAPAHKRQKVDPVSESRL